MFLHLLDQMEEEIRAKYKGMLWYVDFGHSHSRVYFGTKEKVQQLLVLKKGIEGFGMLEEYSPRTHGFVAVPDIADIEFEKEWRPKSSGAIVRYEDKLWRVSGFHDRYGMHIYPVDGDVHEDGRYIAYPENDTPYPGIELVAKSDGRYGSLPKYNTLKDLAIEKLEKEYEEFKVEQEKRKQEMEEYYR